MAGAHQKQLSTEGDDRLDIDKASLVLLYDTSRRFQWYLATCPKPLKDAGLMKLFFEKFPTD